MDHEYGGDVEVSSTVQWRSDDGRFARALDNAAEGAVKETIAYGVELAMAILAPHRRSGRLAGSLGPFMNGPAQGGWYAGAGHALPQEHGARPHTIGAPGQILANKETGFFAKGPVNHPGNPALHFMRDSYRLASRNLMHGVAKRLPG
jgi:hypothetical protein